MYIADLHIHSKYSRATSKDGDIPHLDLWARRKGIGLVGTGDFTHPKWREELEETLEPAEEGFYRIRADKKLRDVCDFSVSPRFVLSGEISCIYKQDGKVRKVHNVILLPSLDAAERLSLKLETIGNIRSDGRPILGISSRDLLAITLDVCPEAVFIPAHIWTPHFSLFGAFSGFDTPEECFGDLAGQIHALETGLSSDPLMNRRVPMLDGYTMVSDSDAHSPAKLGRECNLIETELSYPALKRALETGEGFGGTIEFFPEEGKYHLDGHRNCGVRLTPAETQKYGGKCPVCGKKITIGVLNRVEQLAERDEDYVPAGAKPFEHLIPLPEAIAASLGTGAASTKTEQTYIKMLRDLGSEAEILRVRQIADIERYAGERIAEGIRRLREGKVIKSAGFDGEYGKISLFTPDELKNTSGQLSFLDSIPLAELAATAPESAKNSGNADKTTQNAQDVSDKTLQPRGLNAGQEAAADSGARVTAVTAGPGTGKTHTLVERIVRLVERGVKPSEITAVTFTVRAAEELRERLAAKLKRKADKITVGTFHSVCYSFLKAEFSPASRALQLRTAEEVLRDFGRKCAPNAFLSEVSAAKNGMGEEDACIREYTRRLRAAGALDFDDIIDEALERKFAGECFRCLLVDEFQDVNEKQYELIRQWAGESNSLFVIGDPDQAIYSFRGAAANIFERLQRDFPQANLVRLTKNYRSTPEIIECALRAISENNGERALCPTLPAGAKVRLAECGSELAEGIFVAKEIGKMTGGLDMLAKGREEKQRAFGEIAVLARTNRQLDGIRRCLRQEGIPCAEARADFLESPAVSGTLAFFAALAGGNETEAENFLGGRENFEAAREKFLPQMTGKPRKVLAAWREYQHIAGAEFDKLVDAAHYARMEEFLDAMLLGKEGDAVVAEGKTAAGAVRLSTLHGAKGLEFPVVFLCGMTEGVFPREPRGAKNGAKHNAADGRNGAESDISDDGAADGAADGDSETDEAEERRLFYVGITRAKEELILTAGGKPSPFLSGLPQDIIKEKTVQRQYKQLSMF